MDKGLRYDEATKVMKDILMGIPKEKCSVKLDTKEKSEEYDRLKSEIDEERDKGGVITWTNELLD